MVVGIGLGARLVLVLEHPHPIVLEDDLVLVRIRDRRVRHGLLLSAVYPRLNPWRVVFISLVSVVAYVLALAVRGSYVIAIASCLRRTVWAGRQLGEFLRFLHRR